jgi:HSP20 family protein
MTGNDINVELQGNTLKVSGQKSQQREEGGQGHKVWRQERSFSQFSRSFELPGNAQPEGITANLDHGVLTVEVSRREEEKSG